MNIYNTIFSSSPKTYQCIYLKLYFLSGEWKHWNTRVEEWEYPSDSTPEYGSILVPNVDNVRTDFLIATIAKQSKVR